MQDVISINKLYNNGLHYGSTGLSPLWSQHIFSINFLSAMFSYFKEQISHPSFKPIFLKGEFEKKEKGERF